MAFVFSAKDGSGDITDDGGKIVQFKTAEDAASWAEQNGVDPDVFDIDEVDFAKERADIASKLPQEIEQARQQQIAEDQASDPWFKKYTTEIAKQALRTVAPYTVESMEKTGEVSQFAPSRDVANNLFMLYGKPLQMLGSALGRTAVDVSQQQENGEVDPTRTGIVAGLNLLPTGSGKMGQYLDATMATPAEFVKDRASKQLYSSIVGNKVARLGRNPITPQSLRTEFLEKGAVPIASTEVNAFKEMERLNDQALAQKGATRERIEATTKEPVNVLKYDFDTQGDLMLGAISDAIANVKADVASGVISPDRGKAMLNELNRQDKLFFDAYKSGNRSLKQASRLVTSLNKEAKTFTTANREGTPKSDAFRAIAESINDRIGMIGPEHREASKSMAVNMSFQKPLEERIASNTANAPTSGIASLPFVNELINIGSTFNRRPQGAALKFKIGEALQNNSPMIRAGLETQRQLANKDAKTLSELYGTK